MTKQATQTINGVGASICALEAQGFANCFQAYANNAAGEDIIDGGIGFNANSGYTYIALENGVTICSCMGQTVEYLVTNFETGEEIFYSNYEEATNS